MKVRSSLQVNGPPLCWLLFLLPCLPSPACPLQSSDHRSRVSGPSVWKISSSSVASPAVLLCSELQAFYGFPCFVCSEPLQSSLDPPGVYLVLAPLSTSSLASLLTGYPDTFMSDVIPAVPAVRVRLLPHEAPTSAVTAASVSEEMIFWRQRGAKVLGNFHLLPSVAMCLQHKYFCSCELD